MRPPLLALAEGGLAGAMAHQDELEAYVAKLATVDPDTLSRDEALAFWINLYNAGGVQLAVEAFGSGAPSVLRVSGAFSRPFVVIAGESLSLAAIEHAKIRRFKDPRIHGALVCGSLSCPTLRPEPYVGLHVDDQLEDQMRLFLSMGGAVRRDDEAIELSRIFWYYGPDFVRPERMPSFWPVSKRRVLRAAERWLPVGMQDAERLVYQEYDWGLACAVR